MVGLWVSHNKLIYISHMTDFMFCVIYSSLDSKQLFVQFDEYKQDNDSHPAWVKAYWHKQHFASSIYFVSLHHFELNSVSDRHVLIVSIS